MKKKKCLQNDAEHHKYIFEVIYNYLNVEISRVIICRIRIIYNLRRTPTIL